MIAGQLHDNLSIFSTGKESQKRHECRYLVPCFSRPVDNLSIFLTRKEKNLNYKLFNYIVARDQRETHKSSRRKHAFVAFMAFLAILVENIVNPSWRAKDSPGFTSKFSQVV